MERFIGLAGIVAILGIAFALSTNRKAISLRVVGWGLGLQVLFALIVAVGAFLAFMLFGVQYYLFAGLLIGNAWEALRRAATRRLPRATAG